MHLGVSIPPLFFYHKNTIFNHVICDCNNFLGSTNPNMHGVDHTPPINLVTRSIMIRMTTKKNSTISTIVMQSMIDESLKQHK
jgi:hypothetical protein